MKFVKSLHRASLTNEDLRELIHTALTSYKVANAELENKPIKVNKQPKLPKFSQTEFNFLSLKQYLTFSKKKSSFKICL